MSDIRDVMGKWWVGPNADLTLDGTLTFDPATGGVLRVSGQFDLGETTPGYFMHGDTVHGHVLGKWPAFTLLNCTYAGSRRRGSWSGPSAVEQRLRTPRILAGYRQPVGEPPEFSYVVAGFEGLSEWVWARGNPIDVSSSRDEDGRWVETFAVHEMPLIEFDVPDGIVKLGTRGSTTEGIGRVEIEREAVWIYEPSAPQPLDELREVTRALEYFHVVLTGEPTRETYVSVGQYRDDETPDDVWRVISTGRQSAIARRDRDFECPVPRDALPDLAESVRRWLGVYSSCKLALFGILTVLNREADLVSEVELFTLAQAAEAYHRCSSEFANHVGEYADYRNTVKHVLSEIARPARQWALSRLRDEPSFSDRIRELVEYAGPFGAQTTSYANFAGVVTDHRNVWAHGLERKLEGEDWDFSVHWTAVKLRLVLHACLLRDVGLSGGEVLAAMGRSPKYLFESTFDPSQGPVQSIKQ